MYLVYGREPGGRPPSLTMDNEQPRCSECGEFIQYSHQRDLGESPVCDRCFKAAVFEGDHD